MNTLTEMTPSLIMASGLKRITALTAQHGITSPQVWDACVRWGGILDDVNHPDSSCRYCGEAVTFISEMQTYYHVGTKSKHCRTHAGRTAAPIKTTDSGVAFIPTTAKKPSTIVSMSGRVMPNQMTPRDWF